MGFPTTTRMTRSNCIPFLGWRSSTMFMHKVMTVPPPTKFRLNSAVGASSINGSSSSSSSSDPLPVKAARGEPVSRPPAWMMRQAGSLGKLSTPMELLFSLTYLHLYLHLVFHLT